MDFLTLRWPEPLSDAALTALCDANPTLRIERSAAGELIVLPPMGASGAAAEAELIGQVWAYARERGGRAFSSEAGLSLDEEALRQPDAAYVTAERWAALTRVEHQVFLRVPPDAVFELRSRTDRLPPLREKLAEYVASGVPLVVFLDPVRAVVEILRPGLEPVVLKDPASVDCGEPMPGFALDVRRIFDLANE